MGVVGLSASSPLAGGPLISYILAMLLTKPKFAHHFDFCPVVFDLDDLTGGDVLLCIFGPIAPARILKRYRRAYNVHPGDIAMMNEFGPALLDGSYVFPSGLYEDWCGPVRKRKDLLGLIDTNLTPDSHLAFTGFM